VSRNGTTVAFLAQLALHLDLLPVCCMRTPVRMSLADGAGDRRGPSD
jgi:hypothetical protein